MLAFFMCTGHMIGITIHVHTSPLLCHCFVVTTNPKTRRFFLLHFNPKKNYSSFSCSVESFLVISLQLHFLVQCSQFSIVIYAVGFWTVAKLWVIYFANCYRSIDIVASKYLRNKFRIQFYLQEILTAFYTFLR